MAGARSSSPVEISDSDEADGDWDMGGMVEVDTESENSDSDNDTLDGMRGKRRVEANAQRPVRSGTPTDVKGRAHQAQLRYTKHPVIPADGIKKTGKRTIPPRPSFGRKKLRKVEMMSDSGEAPPKPTLSGPRAAHIKTKIGLKVDGVVQSRNVCAGLGNVGPKRRRNSNDIFKLDVSAKADTKSSGPSRPTTPDIQSFSGHISSLLCPTVLFRGFLRLSVANLFFFLRGHLCCEIYSNMVLAPLYATRQYGTLPGSRSILQASAEATTATATISTDAIRARFCSVSSMEKT